MTTQSAQIRRINYSQEREPLTPILIDDPTDSLGDAEVLDTVLKYDPTKQIIGYRYDIALGQQVKKEYYQKVLDIVGLNSVVVYYPLWELSGSFVRDIVGQSTGTYSNVAFAQSGIGDGRTSIGFTASGTINIYNGRLTGTFNRDEGTLMIWGRILSGPVWSDGSSRTLIKIATDDSNRVEIDKSGDGNIVGGYIAGGTVTTRSIPSNTTNFFNTAFTYSKSADEAFLYLNGVPSPIGVVKGLGTWVGSLNTGHCFIGQYTSVTAKWKGYLAHALVLNRAATPNEIYNLSLI